MYQERTCVAEIKPYIPGKPIDEVERELGIKNIVKIASNENPLGPSEKAVEAMKKEAAKVNLYPDGSAFHLRKALADYLKVESNKIIISNGSEQLIFYLSAVYLDPSDEIIMADPSFSLYMISAQVMNSKISLVPLDKDYKHDLKSMLDKINSKTKMIYVCNPNNPTGTVVGKQELDEFIAAVPEDILIILDEAYFEYVDQDKQVDGTEYLAEHKNIIVLRTFSKIHALAGLRVGYAIADERIIKSLAKVKQAFNVNSIAQAAALASLHDEDHLSQSQQINSRGRDYLYQEFAAMGLKYVPSQANFILLDIGMDCKTACQELMKMGIIVRPGDIFGYPTFLRVSIGLDSENTRFIMALKKVLNK